jgi:hypothetical protein
VEGEFGTVKGGSAAHVVSPFGGAARRESYTVTLDNGATVQRERYQLAEVPATPTSTPSSPYVNPSPLGGVPAGPNALKVIAVEKAGGFETIAQQLASGNPGIPEPGTEEYTAWKQAGWI